MSNLDPTASFVAQCESRHQGQILDVHQLSESYAQRNGYTTKKEKSQTIRAVVLTDCANAYSSICGLSAGPAEKSCRLLLAHISDNLPTISLSYLDSIFNLADLGAKLRAIRLIWRSLISTGVFRISFLGRKLSKIAQERVGVIAEDEITTMKKQECSGEKRHA